MCYQDESPQGDELDYILAIQRGGAQGWMMAAVEAEKEELGELAMILVEGAWERAHKLRYSEWACDFVDAAIQGALEGAQEAFPWARLEIEQALKEMSLLPT